MRVGGLIDLFISDLGLLVKLFVNYILFEQFSEFTEQSQAAKGKILMLQINLSDNETTHEKDSS